MKRINDLEKELQDKLEAIKPSLRWLRYMGSEGSMVKPWHANSGRHVSVRWKAEDGNLTRAEKREVRRLIHEYVVAITRVSATEEFGTCNGRRFGFDLLEKKR